MRERKIATLMRDLLSPDDVQMNECHLRWPGCGHYSIRPNKSAESTGHETFCLWLWLSHWNGNEKLISIDTPSEHHMNDVESSWEAFCLQNSRKPSASWKIDWCTKNSNDDTCGSRLLPRAMHGLLPWRAMIETFCLWSCRPRREWHCNEWRPSFNSSWYSFWVSIWAVRPSVSQWAVGSHRS